LLLLLPNARKKLNLTTPKVELIEKIEELERENRELHHCLTNPKLHVPTLPVLPQSETKRMAICKPLQSQSSLPGTPIPKQQPSPKPNHSSKRPSPLKEAHNQWITQAGEKLTWTREQDKSILSFAQNFGADESTWKKLIREEKLTDKTIDQIEHRYQQLLELLNSIS
jgi:hypothetical protein